MPRPETCTPEGNGKQPATEVPDLPFQQRAASIRFWPAIGRKAVRLLAPGALLAASALIIPLVASRALAAAADCDGIVLQPESGTTALVDVGTCTPPLLGTLAVNVNLLGPNGYSQQLVNTRISTPTDVLAPTEMTLVTGTYDLRVRTRACTPLGCDRWNQTDVTATLVPDPTPTAAPSVTPTPLPSPSPTFAPTPTPLPTGVPTPSPTPTPLPTGVPTPIPTAAPSSSTPGYPTSIPYPSPVGGGGSTGTGSGGVAGVQGGPGGPSSSPSIGGQAFPEGSPAPEPSLQALVGKPSGPVVDLAPSSPAFPIVGGLLLIGSAVLVVALGRE